MRCFGKPFFAIHPAEDSGYKQNLLNLGDGKIDFSQSEWLK
jgi:hypothetical protein